MTSPIPLDGSGSGTFSIPELVRLAGDGTIRIPIFQRSFVWDAQDVLKLFDSIYRGFPIGTILLWRQRGPKGRVRLGPIEFDVEEKTEALWVVDGQQRITTLFGCLSPQAKNADDRFELYFNLANQRFTHIRRGVRSPRILPVREALETRTLLMWLRQHAEELDASDYDVADRLGGALRDYRILSYIITGNDHDLLREVFDRVNSAGKPITRAQVFHALFAKESEPGSPASVVAELSRLGFGKLDENRVIQSLLAIRGGDVQRDIHEEFDVGDDPADWYDRTEQALERVVRFLRSEGVPHLLLMPNTLPIPVLAAFFYLHPDPSPWILRLLSRWLWRGWVHEFGREGGQTPTLRRAVRSVNPRKLQVQEAPDEYEAVRSLLEGVSDYYPASFTFDKFRTDMAHGRLILLALASLGPLGPDGKPVDLSAELESEGVNAITEFIPNERSKPAARGFWPRKSPRPTGAESPEILASHAICAGAASALRRGDKSEFLRRRRDALAEIVQNFLKSRLATGALVRPPLDRLVVPDPGANNEC